MRAEWIVLIGTLGGVGLGAASSAFRDARSWRRQESVRWLGEIRTVSAAVLLGAERVISARRTVKFRRAENDQQPVPEESELMSAHDDLIRARADLELLARDSDLVDASVALDLAAWGRTEDEEGMSASWASPQDELMAYWAARDRFVEQTRRVLHPSIPRRKRRLRPPKVRRVP